MDKVSFSTCFFALLKNILGCFKSFCEGESQKCFTKALKTVIIGLSDLSGQKFPLLLLKGWVIMDKIEMIRKAISGPLQEMGIEVDSICFVKEGSYYFLRIVLDKINGIDMDTIVEATHVINPIIDELDPYEESYILDVLSKERGE